MKVLSLFNGISCGRVAFERANIPIERYVSYEIDKYANEAAKANYPNDEYNGDVFRGDFTKYRGFDILIGGSPCTSWSIAKKGRETAPSGIGWDLFMQYRRALTESGCKYFLYENNYSIHKDIKAAISAELGVEPIMINSALVSAQSRKRCYWSNIPGVTQPEDRGILLRDILESGISEREKSYTLDAHYAHLEYSTWYKRRFSDNPAKQQHDYVFEPAAINETNGKCRTLLARYGKSSAQDALRENYGGSTMVAEPVIYQRPHGFNKGGIKSDKSPTVTANGSWQNNNYICEPVRIGGSTETKTDLYSVQLSEREIDYMFRKEGRTEYGYIQNADNDKAKCITANISKGVPYNVTFQRTDNEKKYPIYEVRGGLITIKDKQYSLNLPDGDYIIRKLTVKECCRLQTMPDGYFLNADGSKIISDTRAYRALGNGWTVEVIAHILGFMK